MTTIQGYEKNNDSQFSDFSVIEVGTELISLTERGRIEHEVKLSSECEQSLNEESLACKFWDLKSQPRCSLLISNQSNDYLHNIAKTAIQTHQVDNLSVKLAEVHYP